MSAISGSERSISEIEVVHPMLTPDRLLKPSDELTQKQKTARAAQETLSQLQAQQRNWFVGTALFGIAAIVVPASGIGVAQTGNEQIGNYLIVAGLFGSALLAGICYLKTTGMNAPIQQAKNALRSCQREVQAAEKRELERYGQVIRLIGNCTHNNLQSTLEELNQMGLRLQMTPETLQKIKKVIVLQHVVKMHEQLEAAREKDAPLASDIEVKRKEIQALQSQLDGLVASRQGLAEEVKEMDESLVSLQRGVSENWGLNLQTATTREMALDKALVDMDDVLLSEDDGGAFAIPSAALGRARVSVVQMATIREDEEDKRFEVTPPSNNSSRELSQLPDPSTLPPPPPVPTQE